jgi:cytochrome c553
MRSLLAIAVVATCLPTLSAAQPPEIVKTRCAMCHGEKGEATSEDFPRLAGQHEAYLARSLRDFRAGRRQSIMQRFVKNVTEPDMDAIARYYAAQPVPPPSGQVTELGSVGKYLYEKGNTFSGVPACKTCHGALAHASEKLPRLAGQHVSYLEREIREFIDAKRTNDNEVMHTVAEKLTPLEIRALAEYLAALP